MSKNSIGTSERAYRGLLEVLGKAGDVITGPSARGTAASATVTAAGASSARRGLRLVLRRFGRAE